MDKNTRRRSSRLRKLRAQDINDEATRKGTGRDFDVSSKERSKTTNMNEQTNALQINRRRRTRSSSVGSESLPSSTAIKRTKRTNNSTSKLSISTGMSNRRQTRSLARRAQMQAKSVTPSPVPSTQTKFIFSSTERTSHRRSRRHDYNDDEGSCKRDLPYEVVDLYRNQEHEIVTSSVTFHSPTKTRSKKRRVTERVGKQQKGETYFRRSSNLLMLDSFSSSSTPESLTIHYIDTYGEEYWQSLHNLERPIIDDPLIDSSNETKGKQNAETLVSSDNRTRRGGSNPLGSPASRRSSSTSSSSTSLSTNVTPPEKKHDSLGAWLKNDYMWTEPKTNPQPHQSPGNTKPMTVQPQLTPKMRSILVDWMIELSEHFNFGQSTLHLAVTMVDRVLASGKFMDEELTGRSTSGSSSSNSESSTSKSERLKVTRSLRSSDHSYDSDSYFDNSDDESGYDDDDDNKSKSTRCYLIPRDRFQLLGATCVWIACKIQETAPPKSSDIKYVSDHIYSKLQITRMERRVCNALNFSFFGAPTPHQFLFEYLRASLAGFGSSDENGAHYRPRTLPAASMGVKLATDSVFRDMAHYLLELGRLPYGPTGRNPSLLAAAVVYLARVTLGIPAALKNAAESVASTTSNLSLPSCSSVSDLVSRSDESKYYWTPTLKHYTGYTQSDLRETVLEIHEYQMAAESSNLKAVFNKYRSNNYHRVALKTVVRVEDLGFS